MLLLLIHIETERGRLGEEGKGEVGGREEELVLETPAVEGKLDSPESSLLTLP